MILSVLETPSSEASVISGASLVLAPTQLQLVFTAILVPVKLIVPTPSPNAIPEKTPVTGSITTLEKFIHPAPSPQASPVKRPEQLFFTPPLAGFRFIHPKFSDHINPLNSVSVTTTSSVLLVGLKFTHPAFVLHAILSTLSITPASTTLPNEESPNPKSKIIILF